MNRLTMPNDKGSCLCNGEVCCPDENCSDVCLQERMGKLWEYENAEEQGLLVRLPCKIGRFVYVIDDGKIYRCITLNAIILDGLMAKVLGEKDIEYAVYHKDIGKTVFLTRKAAENALAEREGEET